MIFSLNIAIFAQREQTTSNKPLTAVLLRCVSLLLIMGYLGLGMSEAVAQCQPNLSPASDCNDLSITGSNLTITVPNGVTLSGGDAIGVQAAATGLNLTIATGATVGAGSVYGIKNYGGSINSITNLGSISGMFGIFNLSGTITTIDNLQGSITPLSYLRTLPSFYNIIILSSSNYGKLSVISGGVTSMRFGISSLSAGSSIVSGTAYADVLSGVSPTQLGLANNNETTISGTSPSGYSYTLTRTNMSFGIWSLTITAFSSGSSGSSGGGGTSVSNITAGTLVGLSSIGVTANPVLAGGTLVLNKGDSSSVTIAITSAGGTIQQPTSGSASLSGVFSGAGGLTFIGTGSTIMSGANTYSGGTTV